MRPFKKAVGSQERGHLPYHNTELTGALRNAHSHVPIWLCLFLNVTSFVRGSSGHPLPPTPPEDIWLALSNSLFNVGVKRDKGRVHVDCIRRSPQYCFAKPSLPDRRGQQVGTDAPVVPVYPGTSVGVTPS